MRTLCLTSALLLASLAPQSLLAAVADTDPEPARKKLTKDDIEKAEKAVKAHLEKIKGSSGQVNLIKDEPTERALPGFAFYHVLYRQYPVGRVPPEGLKSSNVFVVEGKDFKPVALTSVKELEKFLKEKLPASRTEAQKKDAAKAAVRLAQEFHQDGFFTFSLEDDSTKAAGKTAAAKTVVMKGGNGSLAVSLTFTEGGKLSELTEKAAIRAGPRPICQATKLLDKDPIVRGMAEQALLYMGSAAREYLEEQKAKASSPELKAAIERIWRKIQEAEDKKD